MLPVPDDIFMAALFDLHFLSNLHATLNVFVTQLYLTAVRVLQRSGLQGRRHKALDEDVSEGGTCDPHMP